MQLINRIFIIVFVFLFLLGALCGGIFYAAYVFDQPAGNADAAAEVFVVEKGENLISIASRLENRNLIKSALYLRIISKLDKSENNFKSGQYSISSTMATKEIHDIIISGKGILIKVTLPEGTTLHKVALILENFDIVGSSDFLAVASDRAILDKYNIPGDTAEGFMFPDSYFFPKGFSAKGVLSSMLDNFYNHLESVCPDYRTLSAKELYDRVVLASIVEREYRREEEAPVIASVFYNRLEHKIALSSCATVEYVITEILEEKHPEYLTYDDLKIDSPYNTYLNKGLPPGPISNPGLISLKAAFSPAKTDYLYFLLKNRETGEHFFSSRFADHNNAKVIYLK